MVDRTVRFFQVRGTIAANGKNAFHTAPAGIPHQALKSFTQRLYDRCGHALAGPLGELAGQPVCFVALEV